MDEERFDKTLDLFHLVSTIMLRCKEKVWPYKHRLCSWLLPSRGTPPPYSLSLADLSWIGSPEPHEWTMVENL